MHIAIIFPKQFLNSVCNFIMGRHYRNRKKNNKEINQTAPNALFDFFTGSLDALASIFYSEDNSKIKKHYRIYKPKR